MLKHQRSGKHVLSTSDSPDSVSTDKDYKSNKCSANAVFNFHLKATPYLWTVCIVTSNFLLFNIIIMYCLSHNLLCSFTINSLKPTISTPQHLYMPCICRHSITDIIHLLYKQLGRSRSPKMRCIHLVYLFNNDVIWLSYRPAC